MNRRIIVGLSSVYRRIIVGLSSVYRRFPFEIANCMGFQFLCKKEFSFVNDKRLFHFNEYLVRDGHVGQNLERVKTSETTSNLSEPESYMAATMKCLYPHRSLGLPLSPTPFEVPTPTPFKISGDPGIASNLSEHILYHT
jgi:hypothetical protein